MLPVQNGIDSTERVAKILGASAVLSGVAYVAAIRAAPGIVVHQGMNRIVFGEPPDGISPRTRTGWGTRSAGASVTADPHPNIRVALWEKLVALTATGGVMAMTRLPIGAIRACPETTALFRGAMEEAATVARALGIPLPAGLRRAALDARVPSRRVGARFDVTRSPGGAAS